MLLRGSISHGDLILSASGKHHLERPSHRILAEVGAGPTIEDFTTRLQTGEATLLEELGMAVDIMMAEGVRNSMRAKCKQLGLWPPLPAPANVDPHDCFFQDSDASLPVIAQRLYNDERRRALASSRLHGMDLEHACAATASFIVDFAQSAGTPLPQMSAKYEERLCSFAAKAGLYSQCEVPLSKKQDDAVIYKFAHAASPPSLDTRLGSAISAMRSMADAVSLDVREKLYSIQKKQKGDVLS
jgi:hypothetical protein